MGIKRRSMFNPKFKASRPERWALGRKMQGIPTEAELEAERQAELIAAQAIEAKRQAEIQAAREAEELRLAQIQAEKEAEEKRLAEELKQRKSPKPNQL
jgi:uncharacterized membrane protein